MKRFLLFIIAYMLVVPVMAQERTDLANGIRILKGLQNAYTMHPLSFKEYALVKTSFYNYRDLQPDSKRFDESAFFYKEGTAFKVMPAYEEYKIFIATPNL